MTFKAFPVNPEAVESGGKENLIVSLKLGRTTLRVMPPYSEAGCWFKEINEYYFNLGGQHLFFPSPRNYGENDPIWNHCREVYDTGNEQAIAVIKGWRPRVKYLVNAFILAEQNGVARLSISVVKLPKKAFEELKKLDRDFSTGYGDITNIEKGVNVNITREGKGLTTTYSVSPHRESSNIRELLKERSLDLDSMELHNLDTVYPTKTEEEMNNILKTLLSSSGEEVEVETEVSGSDITTGDDVKIEVSTNEKEEN